MSITYRRPGLGPTHFEAMARSHDDARAAAPLLAGDGCYGRREGVDLGRRRRHVVIRLVQELVVVGLFVAALWAAAGL